MVIVLKKIKLPILGMQNLFPPQGSTGVGGGPLQVISSEQKHREYLDLDQLLFNVLYNFKSQYILVVFTI